MVKVTGDLIVTGVIRGTVENQVTNTTDVTFSQDVTVSGKIQAGGLEDTVQVVINAHQHQIDNILEVNNADGDQCLSIDRTGAVTITTLDADKVTSDELVVTGEKDEILLKLKGNYSQSEDMVLVVEHTDDPVFRIKAQGDVQIYNDLVINGNLEASMCEAQDVSAEYVNAYSVSGSYVYGSEVSGNNVRATNVYSNTVHSSHYTVNTEGSDVHLYSANVGSGMNSAGNVNIYAGMGGDVSGNGGSLNLYGGNAAAIGDGGSVIIDGGEGAGNGLDNQGGAIFIRGGPGSENGSGGRVQLSSGAKADGGNPARLSLATYGEYSSVVDSSSDINFGNTPLVYQIGGCIALVAGNGSDNSGGLGGEITIRSGDSGLLDRGGDILLESGSGLSGRGGNISLAAGDGQTDHGGDITLTGGDSSGSNTLGGAVNIRGGQGSENGSGGQVYLESGARAGAGYAAIIALSNHIPHELILDASSGLSFETEPTAYNIGGSVAIIAGNGSDASGGVGGAVDIRSGDGGALERGGDITIDAGDGIGERGGEIDIYAGSSLNSTGGNIHIEAGGAASAGQEGGNVIIRAGTAFTSALSGDVVIGDSDTKRVVLGSTSTHCYMPASRRRLSAPAIQVTESTTPVTLTDLAFNYQSGRAYSLKATLFVTADTGSGFKVGYSMSGNHLSSMVMQAMAFNNTTCTYAARSFNTSQTQYLGDEVQANLVELVLSLETTGSGTLTLQGTQQTAVSGDTTTYYPGSFAVMEDITNA